MRGDCEAGECVRLPREDFRIGDVNVLPARNLLVSSEGRITLEPKVMDVLCCLAAYGRDTVSREDIVSSVWRQRFGGDESLTRSVSILRKSFRELMPGTCPIETIPKRGYRLSLPVEKQSHEEKESTPVENDNVIVISVRRGTLAFIASAGLVLANAIVLHGQDLRQGAEAIVATLEPPAAIQAQPVRSSEGGSSPPIVSKHRPAEGTLCEVNNLPPYTPARLQTVWDAKL